MKLTMRKVKTLLVSVLERITGLEPGRVIIAAEEGPRPSEGLYCSLSWESFQPLFQNEGYYTIDEPDDPDKTEPLTQHLRNETFCTVQVAFWGPGAFEMAAYTVGALQNDNRTFDLWRVLGYGGLETVRDVSRKFGGGMQASAMFPLSFYACFGGEYPVEWFDVSQWEIQSAGIRDVFEQSTDHPLFLPKSHACCQG